MAKQYNPTQVMLTYGVLPVSGYADGSMIQVSPVGDGTKSQVGTAGEAVIVRTPNKQHEVTIRLFETSPVNAALALLFNAGNPLLPLTLVSLSTGAFMGAGSGCLERIPGVTYEAGAPVREWKVICPEFDSQFVPVL